MILYVYGGSTNMHVCSNDPSLSYSLGLGKVQGPNVKNINDAKLFNDIALREREGYCDFVYSLREDFTKEKLYHENLCFYFISDVASKRTEVFDTFSSFCHILTIAEKTNSTLITKVVVSGVDEGMCRAVESFFDKKHVSKEYILKRRKKNPFWIQTKFFVGLYLKSVLLQFFGFKRNKLKSDFLFLANYPKHFNNVGEHRIYGDIIAKNSSYLLSFSADGMHQGASLKSVYSFSQSIAPFKQKVILIDAYISLFDCIKHLIFSYRLASKRGNLFGTRKIHKKVDLTLLLKREVEQSFLRIPRLLAFEAAFKRLIRGNAVKKFYYYLHEYPYGKMFSYLFSRYSPSTLKIGVQHGPAARRKMIYYMGKLEAENNPTLPDEVLAEGEQSKLIYEEGGYKRVSIMERVNRLSYLKDVQREYGTSGTVLIAPGLHDGHEVLDTILEYVQNDRNRLYYFKIHPRCSDESLKERVESLKYSNFYIAKKETPYYLGFVDEVIFSYSSVGHEAHILGIKTTILLLRSRINESPMLDIGASNMIY